MDPDGNIVCTMAPSWTYSDPQTYPVSTGAAAYINERISRIILHDISF